MNHYYQAEPREIFCEVCGYLTLCDVLVADCREPETGYLDELALCPECRREREAAMRVHFKNRTGYDLWADIEDVTMLLKLDGTVVTSVADAYCNERLLTPEETDRAIQVSKSGAVVTEPHLKAT